MLMIFYQMAHRGFNLQDKRLTFFGRFQNMFFYRVHIQWVNKFGLDHYHLYQFRQHYQFLLLQILDPYQDSMKNQQEYILLQLVVIV